MQRTVWMFVAAALLLAAPLSACGAPPPPNPIFAEPRFADEPPFRLAVGAIEIVDRDPPTLRPPRVEHLFPVTPARTIRAWARDRLQPVGGPDRLRLTIERARVTETRLQQSQQGLSSAATDQLSERYDAEIEVRLDILDPTGHAVATARARATRYQTVLQSTSPAQRDGIWYDMNQQAMAELSPQLDREIRTHFAAFLR